MQKQTQFNIMGMMRDMSVSHFNPNYAYENMNLRLISTGDNTQLSLVNEKGTKQIFNVNGNIIGQAIFNDKVILFNHIGSDEDIFVNDINISYDTSDKFQVLLSELPTKYSLDFKDQIQKIYKENNGNLNIETLYQGNLNFDSYHPIETLIYDESKDIQKVYWIDGLNPVRMINLKENARNNKYFNFIAEINEYPQVNIFKSHSNGQFAAGTIQYFITYFNYFGSETNIVYQSPLYYISYLDRGAKADDIVNNAFTLSISNLDTQFDYIRIYAIHRTSLNATPSARKVIDLKIENNSIEYTDYGTQGESIDPTDLFYLGGKEIIPYSIAQKNNTLFLGNYKVTYIEPFTDEEKQYFKNLKIVFKPKPLPIPLSNENSFYVHTNQLKYNSYQIKGFKYLEWYRFGVQLQSKTGEWSNPIWIGDYQCNIPPGMYSTSTDSNGNLTYSLQPFWYTSGKLCVPYAELENQIDLNNETIVKLYNKGYRNIRPVVVYPKLEDRECICQGVLNPTVFNIYNRSNNSCYTQASWFFRPNIPYNLNDTSNFSSHYTNMFQYQIPKNSSSYGVWHEFRHYRRLGTDDYNMEIQCSRPMLGSLKLAVQQSDLEDTKSDYYVDQSIVTLNSPELEFDDSIKNLNLSQFKLRIVGMIPITGCASDISIQTSTPTLNRIYKKSGTILVDESNWTQSSIKSDGFFKNNLLINNVFNKTRDGYYSDSHDAFRHQGASLNWFDQLWGFFAQPLAVQKEEGDVGVSTDFNEQNNKAFDYGFLVYPWHRNGSLNNQRISDDNTQGGISSKLSKKIISNLQFSYCNAFYTKDDVYKNLNLSDIQLFDSNEDTIIKLKNQSDGLEDIIYKGNLDTIVLPVTKNYYFLSSTDKINKTYGYPIMHCVLNQFPYSDDGGKNINKQGQYFNNNNRYGSTLFGGLKKEDFVYKTIKTNLGETNINDKLFSGIDPVSIKYKSTPHVVLSIKNSDVIDGNAYNNILPTTYDYINYSSTNLNLGFSSNVNDTTNFKDKDAIIPDVNKPWEWMEPDSPPLPPKPEDTSVSQGLNNQSQTKVSNIYFHWKFKNEKSYFSIKQDNLKIPCVGDFKWNKNFQYGWLWLGELYNDDVTERFGGTSDDALQANEWFPCGDFVSLNSNLYDKAYLRWLEGDTFYQRYDCLKTYPFTNEDQNQIVEILSFMVETHLNLDGRYDKNRGLPSNLHINPTIFNLRNSVYDQQNNFFTYHILDDQQFYTNEFNNQITWSKTKTSNDITDKWLNITLASIQECDKQYGSINSIKNFNNNLFVFQDNAISNILYNEQIQISPSIGVPIEIANSGKVTGIRYINTNIGCQNKFSICLTTNGVYFVDNKTQDIYKFSSEGFVSLSDTKGFRSWINEVNSLDVWNPKDFNNIITYYDKTNGDVLFINKDYCLAYNEINEQFISFYSYENTPYLFNLYDKNYLIKNNYVWEMHGGNYNSFFNINKPYYTTFVVNGIGSENGKANSDKIFDTLEFTADLINPNINKICDYFNNPQDIPFDYLTIWNEYQIGSTSLQYSRGISNLKEKFRIWRAIIPRNNGTRDRIRNPWAFIKLSKNGNLDNKQMILHTINVKYFEQ